MMVIDINKIGKKTDLLDPAVSFKFRDYCRKMIMDKFILNADISTNPLKLSTFSKWIHVKRNEQQITDAGLIMVLKISLRVCTDNIYQGFVYGIKQNGEYIIMPVRANEDLNNLNSTELMIHNKCMYVFPIHIPKVQAEGVTRADVVATISSASCTIVFRSISDATLKILTENSAIEWTDENFALARIGNLKDQKYASFESMRSESVRNRYPSRNRNKRTFSNRRSSKSKSNGRISKKPYQGKKFINSNSNNNKDRQYNNKKKENNKDSRRPYKNNDRTDNSRGKNNRKVYKDNNKKYY